MGAINRVLVARLRRPWPKRVMAIGAKRTLVTEDQRWGAALKLLREAKGLTQAQAAERMPGRTGEPLSVQAWQNYEGGHRRFIPRLIAAVTRALGATPEDLRAELDKVPPLGAAPREPATADGPLVGIVTREGNLIVRRFDHMSDGKLVVCGVNEDAPEEYDLGQVRSVHALKFGGLGR